MKNALKSIGGKGLDLARSGAKHLALFTAATGMLNYIDGAGDRQRRLAEAQEHTPKVVQVYRDSIDATLKAMSGTEVTPGSGVSEAKRQLYIAMQNGSITPNLAHDAELAGESLKLFDMEWGGDNYVFAFRDGKLIHVGSDLEEVQNQLAQVGDTRDSIQALNTHVDLDSTMA